MKTCPTCSKEWPDDQRFCPNDGTALRTAGKTDLVGSIIAGNYHISKKLGEGGMGAVYLGEHVKMGRKSAIKVMTQSMAKDPDAIARFNREATNAARINHPNVCAIYDFGETQDGLIYLAMEFIEGGSLTSVIEQGAVSPARATTIIKQAGDALSAAHDLGIVHRDLKPDNIMITKGRSGEDVVKVVDFGIAKAMGGEEGQKVTKTGLVVGTPEYMSPEQLSGDKLDGRSDIYSLALVFYRMLTGTLPFQADSAQETMIKRLTDDPMPLNEAMPGANFPRRLQMVMDKALKRMPAERYTKAVEFARDAARALEGVEAVPITEGKTQLIDPGATEQIAATRVGAKSAKTRTPETPMPRPSLSVPAPKKKSSAALVAAVIGVVVVGSGGFAAWKIFGGGAAAGNQQTQGTVTDNTATKTATGNPRGGSTRNSGTQSQTGTRRDSTPSNGRINTQTETNPARPDSAAISAQIDNLLDDVADPAKYPVVRQRAADIYTTNTNPKNLRGDAAFIMASVYEGESNVSEACRWINNALIQRPAYGTYEKYRMHLACK